MSGPAIGAIEQDRRIKCASRIDRHPDGPTDLSNMVQEAIVVHIHHQAHHQEGLRVAEQDRRCKRPPTFVLDQKRPGGLCR
jgi:hypothetical protein